MFIYWKKSFEMLFEMRNWETAEELQTNQVCFLFKSY